MLPHSIRGRLLLWLALLLVCILGGFGATAFQLYRTNQLNLIDDELESRVSALQSDWRFSRRPDDGPPEPPGGRRGGRGRPPEGFDPETRRPRPPGGGDGFRLSEKTAQLFSDAGPTGFYFAGWTSQGELLARSKNLPEEIARPVMDSKVRILHRDRGSLREVYYFTERGDCVLAGVSIAAVTQATRQFAGWLVAVGAGVLIVGLAGAGMIVTLAIRPVRAIGETAARIAAGNLSERVSVADARSELGQLAGVLNSTFARLEAAFTEQKNFTADASHELRTPLAILITETQTSLARERSAAEYRSTVASCLETAQQMRRLAEALLQLARFDAGQETLQRAGVDLAGVVERCADRLQPLAAKRGLRIHRQLESVSLSLDEDRITQVVTNLLHNAISYNREGGEIYLGLVREKSGVTLKISNTGPGIAGADLSHVFERFYRADKARVQSEGHSGLGLSIVKMIVEAHGASIVVRSEPDGLTEFTVHFPTVAVV